MKQYAHALIAAMQFLTRIPIPKEVPFTNEVLKRSTLFFPIAGGVIGLFIWGAGAGLSLLLPTGPAAAMTLALMLVVTGGLHMDGLMDTADGIFSSRSRERMLEIMKDSRVGAMGVIACVLMLLLKWSLLMILFDANAWHIWIVIPFIWSRAAMVWAMTNEPYARAESGLGSYFQGLTQKHVSASYGCAWVLTAAAVAVMMLPIQVSPLMTMPAGIIPGWPWLLLIASPLLGIVSAWGISRYLSKKLGGLTGDTYGALNECTEMVFLLLLVVLCGMKG
ncbi:adenosylcobinamide-GDP ribazoletransferase [Paenibacillus alvei]|uniref:Adenosylcobinamide-GDP ribazoletransferase n=1 Tax=Paenibacillus alvei TaxID=44250 RepID=A0AAP7DJF5_PAEAL|nr:adenosylcobinamide-GDP ribazoletransferase [Paenibacillus alvei]NEZ43057.1 adenosylcobinamide-GDP ribazoletransferase [Paenibacillus alvei]NOJ71875.1 adenosylcobinamide-GDP ribazoletransferase [Paenibacillus alvei]